MSARPVGAVELLLVAVVPVGLARCVIVGSTPCDELLDADDDADVVVGAALVGLWVMVGSVLCEGDELDDDTGAGEDDSGVVGCTPLGVSACAAVIEKACTAGTTHRPTPPTTALPRSTVRLLT